MQDNCTPDTPQKQCTQCEKWWPETTEYFRKHQGGKNGLSPSCKDCAKKHAKKMYAITGKDAAAASMRKYRQSDPAGAAARDRRYYQANREKIKARVLKYRESHLDDERLRSKKYRDDNKSRLSEQARQRYNANYDKHRIYSQRRLARKAGLPDTLTKEQWFICLDYFNGRCAACGNLPTLFDVLEMDHFVPLVSPECLGTVKENIVPLCRACNRGKQTLNALVWATRKFGKKKADIFVLKVQVYFDSIRDQK